MPYKDLTKRKAYNIEYQKRYYLQNRKRELNRKQEYKKKVSLWWNNYKKRFSCTRCPETHPACLEFHHNKDKKFNISQCIRGGYSKKSILEELKKCTPLCSNCHRKLHFEETQKPRCESE